MNNDRRQPSGTIKPKISARCSCFSLCCTPFPPLWLIHFCWFLSREGAISSAIRQRFSIFLAGEPRGFHSPPCGGVGWQRSHPSLRLCDAVSAQKTIWALGGLLAFSSSCIAFQSVHTQTHTQMLTLAERMVAWWTGGGKKIIIFANLTNPVGCVIPAAGRQSEVAAVYWTARSPGQESTVGADNGTSDALREESVRVNRRRSVRPKPRLLLRKHESTVILPGGSQLCRCEVVTQTYLQKTECLTNHLWPWDLKHFYFGVLGPIKIPIVH